MKSVASYISLIFGLLFAVSDASAARVLRYSGDPQFTIDGFHCVRAAKFKAGPLWPESSYRCDPDEDGVQSKIKACPNGQSCDIDVKLWGGGNGPYLTTIEVFGGCKAGTSVGEFRVPDGYMKAGMDGPDAYVQKFPIPGPFAKNGCMVGPVEVQRCFVDTSVPGPAAGIEVSYCVYRYAETGETGGIGGAPDMGLPTYTPPGGGTDPGGGGTDPGGGGTDPGGGGTNPGGGGTDPGGGGTDPGGGGTDPGGGGTDPGGGGTGGDGTSDLCTKHPNLNVCKNSSWVGSCGDITCNGDAIQCEILRQQAAELCRAKSEREFIAAMRERQLGEQLLAGNDPDKDKLPSIANGEKVDLPTFDKSGWLGGGQCFADKVVSVMGSNITIPFSQTCQYLVILRYALMVVALLISFKVLSGAIIRD